MATDDVNFDLLMGVVILFQRTFKIGAAFDRATDKNYHINDECGMSLTATKLTAPVKRQSALRFVDHHAALSPCSVCWGVGGGEVVDEWGVLSYDERPISNGGTLCDIKLVAADGIHRTVQ